LRRLQLCFHFGVLGIEYGFDLCLLRIRQFEQRWSNTRAGILNFMRTPFNDLSPTT
jgi:hypothetical protein